MKTSAFATILRSTLTLCALPIAASVFTLPAMAQTALPVARVSIPFAFYIGNQAMPAGLYSIDHEASTLFLLRGPSSSGEVLTHPVTTNRPPARGFVAFRHIGNAYFLGGLWSGGTATGMECPESSTEKKLLQESKRQLPSATTLAFNSGTRP